MFFFFFDVFLGVVGVLGHRGFTIVLTQYDWTTRVPDNGHEWEEEIRHLT